MSSNPTPDIQPPAQYTPADLAEALRLLEADRDRQQQAAVRVEQLAEVADPASIPADMADYFAGRGLRVAMASILPREMARLARFQRVPLRITDVPEGKDRKLFQGWLAQGGFREVGGHYLHGDTCIYKQPIKQWENLGFDAYHRWANMQSDPATDAAAIQDTVDGQVRHGAKVIALGADPDDAGGRPLIPGAVRR